MDDFPDELLDRICSFMRREELCTTVHISSSLRRVASHHLLFQLGIPLSDVRSGTVKLALSKSLYLILLVAHICPIRRLECFEDSELVRASEYQRLASILSATAPIPDLLIHDKLEYGEHKHRDFVVLHLLAQLPQTATDTLLIVSEYSAHVSRPRAGPPPPWAIPPAPDSFSICQFVYDLILLIPIWLHVQSLPKKYTLITPLVVRRSFAISPLRGVPDSVYSTFLASLDLPCESLKVKPETHVALAELVSFVARQENLRTLSCAPDSIRPSSLSAPSQHRTLDKIWHLGAPAYYIPHLLPLTPHVEWIYLAFPSPPTWLSRIVGSWPFDYVSYCTALNAIARLPGSHSLTLSLSFDLTATNFNPWSMGASDAPQPERQLHRVEHITIHTTPDFYVFSASSIRALAPWLARFPSLRRLSFDNGAVSAYGRHELPAAAEVIDGVCPGDECWGYRVSDSAGGRLIDISDGMVV
ncbi:hypothetical protein FB45DRAFT_1050997 [Roridomyces roridus]|uniref:F-box domain-containing protein n=1 Tax=Roridomyces roridus TaxID=1738132 RepID=A0AAD7CKP9_9AGAR|nr:hypothetical protein FB45DRAFT_1050997 [Roridomyces roridus]